MSLTRTSRPVWGDRTYVMGVLNITPDSFSGDGLGADNNAVAAAVEQARSFLAWGADILDVGGESTRPGSGKPPTGDDERRRVLPVIRALRAEFPDTVISIDTYRAETARQALAAGADWINDIWGLKFDPEMPQAAAEADCPVVIMHNGRNRPRLSKDDQAGGYYGYFHYDDLVAEVITELAESVQLAVDAGASRENLILDPGIGFGKTGAQNIELIHRLDALKVLGLPILLGTSRKGFIGHVLGGLPAHERVEGTAATCAIGIDRGADIIRVHDVKEMVRTAKMVDALVRR